ncbi:apolipoprotein A-IV-like [Gouania willdenowi]|uniref:Apolipoprotein A-IV n=1 Tax=Gouania willdenowi TaxID=441366 RepID=A0A8C5HNP8_GOUWI|nr:apolipoprotein A-IV-like [Gouania willdenowi]
MRALVVFALLAVCNANILWHEVPKTNLEMVKEAFWDYVAKATHTAEESMKQIKESELGQEVNAKISQSTDTVNQYIVSLRTQVAPLTQDFITQFTQETEQLKARLEKDMTAVSENLQPYAEQLVARLQAQVEELKKEAAPYAEAMDPEALKTILLQKSQEMKGQLDQGVKNLQNQMVPYTEEMKKIEQSLEEFQKNLLPMAQSFETQMTLKVEEMQQRLTQGGEELKAKLEAGAQDMQAQLSALWDAFTKMAQ